ncbi:uncharacterized protein JCM6883_001687 [Sporobolomyces salmoneus]|uniref:uncharacterized protein n=1 Tax=Sporobolomyces salmoneus TaxID=183962 RepID=UPI003173FF36
MLPTRRSSRLKKGSSSSSRPLISPTFPGSSGVPAPSQPSSGVSFNQSGDSWTPFVAPEGASTPQQLPGLPSPSSRPPFLVKKDYTHEITSGVGRAGMRGIEREVGGGGAWGGNSSSLSFDGVVGEGAGALTNYSQEFSRFNSTPSPGSLGSTLDPSGLPISKFNLPPLPPPYPSPVPGGSSIGTNSSSVFTSTHHPQLGNDGVRGYGARDENEGDVAAEEEDEEEEERFIAEMVDREFEEEDDMVTGAGEYAMEAGSVEDLAPSGGWEDPLLGQLIKSLTNYYEGDLRLALTMIQGVRSGVSRLEPNERANLLQLLNGEIARISRDLPLHLRQDYLVEWRRSSNRAFHNGIPVMVPHPTDPSTKLVHVSNWKPTPLDRNQTALSERDWLDSGIWQDEVTHFDESPFMYDNSYSGQQPHRKSLTAEGQRLLDKVLLAKLSIPILDQTLIEVSGSDILEDIFENEGLVLQAIEVTSEWDALKPREKEKENESTYDLRLYHIRLKDQPEEDGTLMVWLNTPSHFSGSFGSRIGVLTQDLNVAAIQSLSPPSLTFDCHYFERKYGDYAHPASKGAVDGSAIARTLKLERKLGRVLSLDEIRALDPAAARVADRYGRLPNSLLNNKVQELSSSPDPLQRSICFAIQRLMIEKGKETKAMFQDWESRVGSLTEEQLKRLNERNLFNKKNREWYRIQKETDSPWYRKMLEQQHDYYWYGGGREKASEYFRNGGGREKQRERVAKEKATLLLVCACCRAASPRSRKYSQAASLKAHIEKLHSKDPGVFKNSGFYWDFSMKTWRFDRSRIVAQPQSNSTPPSSFQPCPAPSSSHFPTHLPAYDSSSNSVSQSQASPYPLQEMPPISQPRQHSQAPYPAPSPAVTRSHIPQINPSHAFPYHYPPPVASTSSTGIAPSQFSSTSQLSPYPPTLSLAQEQPSNSNLDSGMKRLRAWADDDDDDDDDDVKEEERASSFQARDAEGMRKW